VSEVVLMSGGLDSAVCLGSRCLQSDLVFGVTVIYGQRHSREIDASRLLAKHYNLDNRHFLVCLSGLPFKSSLVSGDVELDVPYNEMERENPKTYVPFRNLTLISIGAAVAESVGAKRVVYGANAVDFSGYWDCRPEFVELVNQVLKQRGIELLAPLVGMKKSDIVRFGFNLKVPFSKTYTCYLGGEKCCGRCDACRLRYRAFVEAGFLDCLQYERVPLGLSLPENLKKYPF